MQNTVIVKSLIKARYLFFKWRYNLTFINKLILSFGMACIIGFLAQIKFFLPWTPVPIVCSTLGVVLAGVLLGRLWGGISVIIYAVIGFAGVPWFAGFKGGFGVLLGPTGGYIIGFILAALFVGYFTDTFINSRKLFPMLGIILFAHFVLMYVPGLLALNWWLGVSGKSVSFIQLLWMGAIPFIPGDVLKSIIAAGIVKVITPKQSYNGEVDKEKIWRIL